MYGAVDDEGVLLIVNETDVSELVAALDGGTGCLALTGTPPPGYLGAALSELNVVLDDEPLVRVAFKDDQLQVAGSRTALARLASELRLFVAENDLHEPGIHTHFDPGTPMSMSAQDTLVAADSVPLMVAGPVY